MRWPSGGVAAGQLSPLHEAPTVGLYAAKNAVLVAAQLKLGGNATRLLLHMALECWDEKDNPSRHEPRRYFGRRESSAIALGFLAPANGTDAAFQAVKRAVRELSIKGAIRRIRPGGNGKSAEYELLLDSSRPGRYDNDVVPLPFLNEQGVTYRPPEGVTL